MDDPNTVIGCAWYRREQWERLRAVAADGDALHESYDAWLAEARKGIVQAALGGIQVKRVDVEALICWCRAEGRPIDGAARAAYVSEELRRVDQEPHAG